MKKIILRIFFPFFIIAISGNAFAQSIDFSQYNSWATGVKFGLLPFYGDVRQLHYSADNKYKKTNTALTFELIKNFNHVFGARLNVMSGGLSGSSENLNMHFTSNLLESSLSGIVNLNDLMGIYPTKNKVINTYLFAGVGAVMFRSKVYSFDEDAYITGFGWDSIGYSKTAGRNELVFPVGVGFKFNADEKFDIGMEFTLHLTNTDKLDAWMVEDSYNDRYSYAAVSFTYKIGSRAEYVDWISPYQDTALANILLARNKSIEPVENNNVVTNNNVTNNNQVVTENNSGIVELKYFIVSGTYTSKKLAKDAADRLISKGYANANYFMQKSSGNWRVYYKGYATLDGALADWVTLKKTNPYAKLLEKKEKESYSDLTASYKNYTPVVKDTTKTQNKNNVVTNNTNSNTNNTTVNNNTNNTNTNNTNNTNTTNNTNNNNTSNTTNNTTTNNNSNTTSNNTNNTTNTNNTNTTNTTNVDKKFFIIAGSFATEDLANQGVTELKAKGFIYAEVVGKNDYGSYRIAYKGYATREDANADLPVIKQNTNPSAWIFEKK